MGFRSSRPPEAIDTAKAFARKYNKITWLYLRAIMGIPFLIIMLSLAGCAAPAGPTNFSHDTPSVAVVPPTPDVPKEQPIRQEKKSTDGSLKLSMAARQPIEALREPDPDAVIKIDPATGQPTEDAERSLLIVADQAKKNAGLLLRLEGYVPSGGSPAFDLGRADENLQMVRERLLRLGVSPRRILVSTFGAEHDEEHAPRRPWVEIYLLEHRWRK